MKSLFDAHKKDALPEGQADVLREMRDTLREYPAKEDQETRGRAKMMFWAKKLGLNISKLTDEELRIFTKTLQQSEAYKKSRRQGKRRR